MHAHRAVTRRQRDAQAWRHSPAELDLARLADQVLDVGSLPAGEGVEREHVVGGDEVASTIACKRWTARWAPSATAATFGWLPSGETNVGNFSIRPGCTTTQPRVRGRGRVQLSPQLHHHDVDEVAVLDGQRGRQHWRCRTAAAILYSHVYTRDMIISTWRSRYQPIDD